MFPEFIALFLEPFVELDSRQVFRVMFGQIIENTLVSLALIVPLE
jgi:hypothetical protein